MKTSNVLHRLLLALGIGGALMAASMGVQAGISGSKHDLTANGTGGNHITGNGTDPAPEICVFCHTPHGSNSSIKAPLWNKNNTSAGLTTYSQTNSSTMDGTVVTGGVSLACLSCHDGTQAMDMMINRPGSGGWTDGLTAARGYGTAQYTWSANVDGKMQAGVFNLGTDLTNDHPIQVQYCGGGMTLSGGVGVMTACKDADFNAPVTMAANTIAYFDGGQGVAANSKRDKNDIQLYSRDSEFFVECGSCHDPHNTTNATFLRRSNANSGVCLTCHNK